MAEFTTITSSSLAYERKYSDQYIHLAAITEDEVTDTFSPEPRFKGEATFLNYIGSHEAREKLSEFERTQFNFMTHSRRMFGPRFIYDAVPVDEDVSWQMVADPMGDYGIRVVEAMNRKRAAIGTDSIFADISYETVDAGNGARSVATLAFPAANKVAYNFAGGTFSQTGTGLNFDKLLQANKLMFNNKISPLRSQGEKIYVLVDYATWLGFLGQRVDVGANDELVAVNKDFLTSKDSDFSPGGEKQMGPWAFRFVHTLPVSGSDTLIPMYLPSGIKKGSAGPPRTTFHEPDMFVSVRYIKAQEKMGFLRSEDEKVYQIAIR